MWWNRVRSNVCISNRYIWFAQRSHELRLLTMLLWPLHLKSWESMDKLNTISLGGFCDQTLNSSSSFCSWLFSVHDRATHHSRRFSLFLIASHSMSSAVEHSKQLQKHSVKHVWQYSSGYSLHHLLLTEALPVLISGTQLSSEPHTHTVPQNHGGQALSDPPSFCTRLKDCWLTWRKQCLVE